MGYREKLTGRVQPFLEPGEQVRWVFPAVGGPSPWVMALAGALLYTIISKPKIVVITDRGIVLLKASKGTNKPVAVEKRGPYAPLGPVKGMWAPIQLGERLYVHKRFQKDVEEYDAAFARGELTAG
ncbi:MAG TPA: hypothetical protein VF519_08850 [Mycobacteriales bacterium]|jgi:hypothetical protein